MIIFVLYAAFLMDPPTKMGRSLVNMWAMGKQKKIIIVYVEMFINEFDGLSGER